MKASDRPTRGVARTGHRAAVAALANYQGVVATPVEHGFQLLQLGKVDLWIERHTEFTTFTVIAPQTAVAAMISLPLAR